MVLFRQLRGMFSLTLMREVSFAARMVRFTFFVKMGNIPLTTEFRLMFLTPRRIWIFEKTIRRQSMATIEFYEEGRKMHIAVVHDAVGVPSADEFISIRAQTWKVLHVTWAVDHADVFSRASLRANVVLEATFVESDKEPKA